MFRKLFHKKTIIQNNTAIAFLSLPSLAGMYIIAHIITLWLSMQEHLFPGTDEFMSIISTCSEIIAGLYGTTLAGYTFFLSRIDALMASDTTLDYVVSSIKNRFKYLILYITFNVLITLCISIILMYIPMPTGEEITFLYRLFCNEFLLFLCFSIVLILRYAILVVNPNCIAKEAAKLKQKLSRDHSVGSVSEFIALYDQLETHCNHLLPANVLNQIHENKGKRFAYTIELLSEQKVLPLPLILDLTRIHRYYECVINCSPLSVSGEMCSLAHRALLFLEGTQIKLPRSK